MAHYNYFYFRFLFVKNKRSKIITEKVFVRMCSTGTHSYYGLGIRILIRICILSRCENGESCLPWLRFSVFLRLPPLLGQRFASAGAEVFPTCAPLLGQRFILHASAGAEVYTTFTYIS